MAHPLSLVIAVVMVAAFLLFIYKLLIQIITGLGLLKAMRLELADRTRRGIPYDAPLEPPPGVDARAVRGAFGALPANSSPDLRARVERYLAMPEGDAKQTERYNLCKWLYDRAAFSHDDFALRKAYNRLRLTLNPWADSTQP